MAGSGFTIKLTSIALNAVIKLSNADLRIHGEKNIPDEPSVFVINHFTRMETFLIPFVLTKTTEKEIISLAHHSFFGGGFGRFLEKLGAVSTNDPDRDRKMIGALLRGDAHCMIFPEGQMIKDKKIVEKGKYMIYNTGIRRPPHTGAGILALRAEFYREKLRQFRVSGFTQGIEEYLRFFGIAPGYDIDGIINRRTTIVPVNITYYPIRARNNIINRAARLFVDRLPERIEEELEVEGTMISEGVDIDINFGEPIPVRGYLEEGPIRRRIAGTGLYLGNEEMKKELHFRRQGLALMLRYMDSIYGMTTVNHDHIFSYILTSYRSNRIREDDFKNRAYLAIERIKGIVMQSSHTSLAMKQHYLLTDDVHGRYASFIDAAKSDGLIVVEGGYIYRNRERFSRTYEFHTIRKDNIVEVLKNEIEPLAGVERCLASVMRLPSWMIRRRLRSGFIRLDREIFERDYERFYLENESKPKNIGMPFFLRKCFSNRGVLLVHGYMAAPEEIRRLAEYLKAHGYTVYGVRMRGHGTAPEDLASREWIEWYESANRGYIVLKNTVREIAVAGFSTGAGIALLQAINKPDRFRAVVSINAPLRVNNIASRLASSVVSWNSFLSKLHIRRGRLEYVTNQPENPHINYLRNPVTGVAELEKFMDVVEKKLKELQVPALIIQGSKDPVVNPASGMEIFDRIGGIDKELCRLHATRHGIVNGEGSLRVFRRVLRFLDDSFRARR